MKNIFFLIIFLYLLSPCVSIAELIQHPQAVSEIKPLNNIDNPAYLPFTQSFFGEINYSNPYGISDLYNYSIQTAYTYKKYAISSRWERYGISEYLEDKFELLFAYRFPEYFSCGYTARLYKLQINSPDSKFKHNLIDNDISLIFYPTNFLIFGIFQKNYISLIKKEQEDLLPSSTIFGVSFSPAQGIHFSWNHNKSYYANINTYQFSVDLLPGFNITTAYSKETSTYGFSTKFIFSKLSFSYLFNYHTFLGTTHIFAINWHRKKISYQPIQYNRPHKEIHALPKVNINNCSFSDLLDLPGINKVYALRIIKYKKIFGPITLKALIQIGLNIKEITTLKHHITGLKKEKPFKQRNFTKKRNFLSIAQRKQLFSKLISHKVSYQTAFFVAQKAKYLNISTLTKFLKTTTLTKIERKIIVKTCKEFL